MSEPLTFDKTEVFITSNLNETSGAPDPDTPFRILVVGDWSGREGRRELRTGDDIGRRKPQFIDRDNFDQVLKKMNVQVPLKSSKTETSGGEIRFQELDDFHPDGIYRNLGLFSKLRTLRKDLADPQTFEEAAATVRGWTGLAGKAPDSEVKPQSMSPLTGEITGASLLDQMLAGGQGQAPAPGSPTGADDVAWEGFLRELVESSVKVVNDSDEPELVEAVDTATGALMRSILQNPAFKKLESAWRALYFLVRNLETGTKLKLYLLDISKDELVADLGSSEDLLETGIYDVLVDQTAGTPGAEPWAVVCGNFGFDASLEDMEALGRLALITAQSGATFLSYARPGFLGVESVSEISDHRLLTETPKGVGVDQLRALPESEYVGLATPRFLLRLPYGSDTNEIESFEFEEFPGELDHEAYLWGNPAFICALLLGKSFAEEGWNFRASANLEVDSLPLHTFEEDGAFEIKPCAEVLLSERAAEAIMEQGVMPLLSMKGSDAVRVARFQSIVAPPKALRGRWG